MSQLKPETLEKDLRVDQVSPGIMPYLAHFSEKGYVPEIIEYANGEMVTENVEGERIGDLVTEMEEEELEDIFWELGVRAGYMFQNYPVEHGDLNITNVVVDGDQTPLIIDWQTGRYKQEFTTVSANVLNSTRELLKECYRQEIYEKVSTAYKNGENTGKQRQQEVPARKLKIDYW